MEINEYQSLASVEKDHWFYRGKRRIVRHWLERVVKLDADKVLVDVGAGTGTWCGEMSSLCRTIGVDPSDEALRIARQRHAGEWIQAPATKLPFPADFADAVTLLDVIEHIDDDFAALMEAVRITRPAGAILVTVPALMSLWSDWDVRLHHKRRYTRRSLLRLTNSPSISVIHCTYTNTVALLPVYVIRQLRKVLRCAATQGAEERIPAPYLNRTLEQLFVVPACWGRVRMPIGVSLLLVLRKNWSRNPTETIQDFLTPNA